MRTPAGVHPRIVVRIHPMRSIVPGSPRSMVPAAALFAAAVAAIPLLVVEGCRTTQPPAPTCASLAPWTFYGGSWSSDGSILEATRNGRGDMVISQRNDYSAMSFSVEMQLRDLYPGTNYGDAGVLFRVRSPHLGVDSYHGYYAGLRASDHALFFGRVDEEWRQLLVRPLPAELTAGTWYRLTVQARGCHFALSAAPAAGGNVTRLVYDDPNCIASGSIGLRVYYTKAAWRDLRLTAP